MGSFPMRSNAALMERRRIYAHGTSKQAFFDFKTHHVSCAVGDTGLLSLAGFCFPGAVINLE
jgi:hypothetical protein